MSNDVSEIELLCPDIGNFKDVAVIDVLVKAGDVLAAEAPLLTLETDKATIDVPAAQAGTVRQVLVAVGAKVSQGTLLVRIAPAAAAAPAAAVVTKPAAAKNVAPATASAPPVSVPAPAAVAPASTASAWVQTIPDVAADRSVQLLVLGAGPGGYTAAFRAADLGLQVTMIERWPTLGGVCLNVGCIPSKALLHAAKVIDEAQAMAAHGVSFGAPTIDRDKLRGWKNKVIGKLTGGLAGLAKQRKVEVVRGSARFLSPHVIEVTHEGRSEKLRFEQCIVAAGSEPIALPFLPQDPRIMDSTGALELPPTDGRMLVIGGGIIGLEMACVYEALGAKLSVVELTSQLMPGCDPDLVKPLEKRLKARYEQILLNTKVTAVKAEHSSLLVWNNPATKQNEAHPAGEAVGYIIEMENGFKIWHMGDTGMFPDMEFIANYYKPDLVLAPIGGNFTMDPVGAAYVTKTWIKPKFITPIHYNSNPIAKGTLAEFQAAMQGAPSGITIMPMTEGQTLTY